MHCEEFLHPPIKPVILYIAGHPVSLNKIITIHEKAKVLYKTKYNDYFGENIHPLLQTLQTALLDLLYELKDTDIQLIIGGGYGIYLKADYVRRREVRSLLQDWPELRSTNDIDLFLRPELLMDSAKLIPLSEVITRLGYQVVVGAEKYQFVKP